MENFWLMNWVIRLLYSLIKLQIYKKGSKNQENEDFF